MFPTITSASLPLIVLAAAALYIGAKYFLKRDEPVDDRRRQAIKLAGECKAAGLDFLAPVLEDFAVGDYPALLHRLRSLADDVRDDGQRNALFDRVFETQLARRMKTPESRQQIVAAMSKLDSSHAALLGELTRHIDEARPAATSGEGLA